jgi:hypothetical protein
MRSMPAQLPDDPTTEQVEAWIELAELGRRRRPSATRVREMATTGAASDPTEFPTDPAAVIEQAGAALAAGVEPGTPAAEQVLAGLVPADLDGPAAAELADRLATFTDRRVERYWQLLGVLNGWPQRAPSVPAFEWLIAARCAPSPRLPVNARPMPSPTIVRPPVPPTSRSRAGEVANHARTAPAARPHVLSSVAAMSANSRPEHEHLRGGAARAEVHELRQHGREEDQHLRVGDAHDTPCQKQPALRGPGGRSRAAARSPRWRKVCTPR